MYVVACNIDEKAIGDVSFTLPGGLKYAREAQVLFEERAVPVKDGKFADSFPGHARHVYQVKIE